MYRKLVAIALTSLSLVALAGCGSSSASKSDTPDATPAPAENKEKPAADSTTATPGSKVGETVTVGGVKFTVNSAKFVPAVGEKKAKDGYTFLIIEATVENTKQEIFHSNSTVQTQVVSADKFLFDKSAIAGLKAGFDADLQPGAKATGEFGFMVPVSAKGLRLIYTPDLLKMEQKAVIDIGDAK